MSKQREALELAEPEQEPVAWANRDELDNMLGDRTAIVVGQKDGFHKTSLYTAPPTRKPLTDDEIMLLANETSTKYWGTEAHLLALSRAIERAHGIGVKHE